MREQGTSGRGAAALAAALLAAVWMGPAAPPAAAQATASGADPTAAPPTEGFRLRGFRSAQFGMDEDAVRAAIAADFGLDDGEIVAGDNTVERTRVLTVRVPDLLPDGGTAQVSYIFGYRSRALIQVGVLWAAAVDPAITPAMLVANGDILRAHLMGQGYDPATVTTDLVLDNGVLLFRGSDAEGHTTILLVQGALGSNGADQTTLTPESLTLLYAQDPENPDILSLSPGSF